MTVRQLYDYNQGSGGKDSFSVSDTRSKCDITESEIREFEKANTDTVTYINGDVRIDTVTVTALQKITDNI